MRAPDAHNIRARACAVADDFKLRASFDRFERTNNVGDALGKVIDLVGRWNKQIVLPVVKDTSVQESVLARTAEIVPCARRGRRAGPRDGSTRESGSRALSPSKPFPLLNSPFSRRSSTSKIAAGLKTLGFGIWTVTDSTLVVSGMPFWDSQ